MQNALPSALGPRTKGENEEEEEEESFCQCREGDVEGGKGAPKRNSQDRGRRA